MKKLIIIPALAFLAVCGMGLFVALAAGITWGTFNAGLLSFMTFLIASLATATTAMCVSYPESQE